MNRKALQPFSLVIPCFNEVGAIEASVRDIRNALDNEFDYELIVVDDGSTDGTSDKLSELEGTYAISVVRHDANRGYGKALKTGIRKAKNELIVITDADGTYAARHIRDLLALSPDSDMVVGARIEDNVEYSRLRMFPKLLLRKYASWLTRSEIPDVNSGMRVFRKEIAALFLNILPDGFSFTTTLTVAMLANGYDVKFAPIDYASRIGKSKIHPVKDTLRFFHAIRVPASESDNDRYGVCLGDDR